MHQTLYLNQIRGIMNKLYFIFMLVVLVGCNQARRMQ